MKTIRCFVGVFLPGLVLAAFCLPQIAQAQAQGQVTTIATGGSDPRFVVVNPVTNMAYVSNYQSGNVTAVDGNNNTTLITVDANPFGLAVNPATNKIYVADFGAQLVTVIKASQNNQTITVQTGRGPYEIGVDQQRNVIYVLNYYDDTVTVINGSTDTPIKTVTVGSRPCAIAVNRFTDKVYVANCSSANVTVIDPTNNYHTLNISTGGNPDSLAINLQTDKIYVTDYNSQELTAIDGATNNTSTVATGNNPISVAVNPVTNQIFVANYGSSSVTVIDGSNLTQITNIQVGQDPYEIAVDAVTGLVYVANEYYYSSSVSVIDDNEGDPTYLTVIQTIPVGKEPVSIAVNPVTDRIFTANQYDSTFSVIYYSLSNAAQFIPVPPCRLIDTRNNGGAIPGGSFRSFPVPTLGGCNIPSTASAFSLNITVVPQGPLGYLTIWPTGEDQPIVSTMNSPDGRLKANAAIVPAGYQGDVNVYVTNTTNVILDIDGYFTVPGSTTYQFYSLPPCRLVDTRQTNGDLGGPYLQAGQSRDFPLLESSCIPQGLGIQAYSLNFTVVPHPSGQELSYLTVWPKGVQQPNVSTLNNTTATLVANAAIVPAGTGGDIEVYPSNSTDLLIDINGYFAAAGNGGLSLYAIQPCRALDTRQVGSGQPFTGLWNPPAGLDVVNGPCAPPTSAGAYVFNATVVPSGSLSYLTLWPHGSPQPGVSTLNAIDGDVTSNMAIVPTADGSIDAYAAGLTHLLVDISSYFAP